MRAWRLRIQEIFETDIEVRDLPRAQGARIRDHQAAIEFFGRCIGDNVLGNVDDAAAGDGDVDQRLLGFGPPRLAQYEIDGHPAPGL